MTLDYKFELEVSKEHESFLENPREENGRTVGTIFFTIRKEIDFEDFFEYHCGYEYDIWTNEAKHAHITALRIIWEAEWFDVKQLENDERFEKFMLERHEKEALEKCKEIYCE